MIRDKLTHINVVCKVIQYMVNDHFLCVRAKYKKSIVHVVTCCKQCVL